MTVTKATRHNVTHGLVEYIAKHEAVSCVVFDAWGMTGYGSTWLGEAEQPQTVRASNTRLSF